MNWDNMTWAILALFTAKNYWDTSEADELTWRLVLYRVANALAFGVAAQGLAG